MMSNIVMMNEQLLLPYDSLLLVEWYMLMDGVFVKTQNLNPKAIAFFGGMTIMLFGRPSSIT